MSSDKLNSWQAVQTEIRRRIQQREWQPGERIPHEAELAEEFGCARSTMNRALRGLADSGLIERKRKAGTRVAETPVRQVRFSVPVLREEIESKGSSFHYVILSQEILVPPPEVMARLQTTAEEQHLRIQTLYTANATPYAYEDRWINLSAVPTARDEAFSALSPNEWLVREVPFDGGDFTCFALSAPPYVAEMLECTSGQGLFALNRTTQGNGQVITFVRLIFHAGYQLHTEI